MYTKLLSITLALLLSDFTTASPTPKVSVREFIPYLELFKKEGIKRSVYADLTGLYVAIAPLPPKILGVCEPEQNVIVIDDEKWVNLTSASKEALIFHELGHCVLGLDHTPGGVMKAVLISDAEYVINREQYLNDLFAETSLHRR